MGRSNIRLAALAAMIQEFGGRLRLTSVDVNEALRSTRQLAAPTLRSARQIAAPTRQRSYGRSAERRAKRREQWKATRELRGNPPGYTYAHRDRLVRLHGARRANQLERELYARRITFQEACDA